VTVKVWRGAVSGTDESWGWIIFWFVATPFVGAAFPPLGLVSLCLALYYGAKKLFG
jgi:hypothetical protein